MSNVEHTTADSETTTEGHRIAPPEEHPLVGETTEVQSDDGDDDDTDGHRAYARNVGASFDDDPADSTQDAASGESGDAAVEGHATRSSPNDDDDPDDTEGHRAYARNVGANFDEGPADDGQDATTGDSDDAPSSDDDPDDPEDTDGHRLYNRNVGVEFDDTEGHRSVPDDERDLVGDTPGAKTGDDDDPDDTEGHKAYARNVGASFDDDPADSTQDAANGESGDADVEGHATGSSPNDDDDPDDTEGHKIYRSNVGASFDDDPADAGQEASDGESEKAPPRGDDPDDPEDTDGHRLYARNVGVEFDDTEGHRSVPADERPLVGDTPEAETGDDDDPDDTEGHKIYARNVGASFD